MAIDETGKWWVGSEVADIGGFLDDYSAEGHKVTDFRISKCACGSEAFHLLADDNEGVAKRICAACGNEHFICDSAEYWEDAEPETWKCVECGDDVCNIGVGFALYNARDAIKWLYVGCRCSKCHILGCFAGWKIAYEPSLQLMDQV